MLFTKKMICNRIVKDSTLLLLGRHCSSSAATHISDCADTGVKSYNLIPGPVKIPLFGTFWIYLPFVGYANIKKLHEAALISFQRYGPIFREEGPVYSEEGLIGERIVNVFSPKDFETVFKSELNSPVRQAFLMAEDYRISRPHLYSNGGLLPSNGPSWWKLRKSFQKPLSPVKEARDNIPAVDEITKEFVKSVLIPGKEIDLMNVTYRLNLELVWQLVFGERLNCFSDPDEILNRDSDSSKLISSTLNFNDSIRDTDITKHKWIKKKTKVYLEAEKCLETLERITGAALERVKNRKNLANDTSLAAKYLADPDLEYKDIFGFVQDLIIGGIDTTSNTSAFLLYYICKNPEVQEKIASEASQLITHNEGHQFLSKEEVNSATYTKAVLKETLRLNPVGIGNARTLTKDVTLSGYLVPSGTVVVMHNMASCRMAEYFPEPEKFLPERWISSDHGKPSPFLVMPFSHGLRSCIARRRAEVNLTIYLLRIFEKLKAKWAGKGDLDVITPFINKPDQPVIITFEDR